jgi:hypothetical protein
MFAPRRQLVPLLLWISLLALLAAARVTCLVMEPGPDTSAPRLTNCLSREPGKRHQRLPRSSDNRLADVCTKEKAFLMLGARFCEGMGARLRSCHPGCFPRGDPCWSLN